MNNKTSFLFIIIIIFFAIDTFKDGKYTNKIKKYKKHAKAVSILFIGFSVLYFIKKNPKEGSNMIHHLNGALKVMPINADSKKMIIPFINHKNKLYSEKPEIQRLKSSGLNSSGNYKRSVSGTKKKYIASQQQWKCNMCSKQLDAWFEIDHVQRLADGGSNHISNLVALCRECHGKKTLHENM